MLFPPIRSEFVGSNFKKQGGGTPSPTTMVLIRGTSGVADCLPCEDQAVTMTETHGFDRVIIE